jgi:hypothetical protein
MAALPFERASQRAAAERPDSVALELAGDAEVRLGIDPRLRGEDIARYLGATGSRLVLVEFDGDGGIVGFVAPGADGLPAEERRAAEWPAFRDQHPIPAWVWVPCHEVGAPLRDLVADRPGYLPCLLLSPPQAELIWSGRPSSAGARHVVHVELARRRGQAVPELSIDWSPGGER